MMRVFALCLALLCGSASAQVAVNGTASTYTLYQWGVPIMLPSSGSFANNGALTLTTALPNNAVCSATAGCYMYFPANAIAAGVAAGPYYTQCSSTTACTVSNNLLSSGPPVVVASPVAFSVTGPGAYTQTTSSITLMTLTVPPNSLGANGSFTIYTQGQRISNANTVTQGMNFGGSSVGNVGATSVQWYGFKRTVRNQGVTNSQISLSASAISDTASVNGAANYLTIDTTASKTIVITGQLNTAATDWLVIDGGQVTIDYAP